jgi:hypothetical protein
MIKRNAKMVLSDRNDVVGFIEEDISKISPEALQGIFEWLRHHHNIVVFRHWGGDEGHGAVCAQDGDYVICDWTLEENETEAECIATYRGY